MEALEDIDNQTVERFYNYYTKSNGDPLYKIVVLGVWTVDIKLRLRYLTNEPGNLLMYRTIIRGSTHKRPRPENSRFGAGSITASLTKRGIEFKLDEHNWIGKTWIIKYNGGEGNLPSLNQISAGLVEEA